MGRQHPNDEETDVDVTDRPRCQGSMGRVLAVGLGVSGRARLRCPLSERARLISETEPAIRQGESISPQRSGTICPRTCRTVSDRLVGFDRLADRRYPFAGDDFAA